MRSDPAPGGAHPLTGHAQRRLPRRWASTRCTWPSTCLPGSLGGRPGRSARVLGVRQLAVSLPHKEAVPSSTSTRVDATARRIGAVNTVTRQVGQDLVGAQHGLDRAPCGPSSGRRLGGRGPGGGARRRWLELARRGLRAARDAAPRVHGAEPHRGAGSRPLAADLSAPGRQRPPRPTWRDLEYDLLVNTTSRGPWRATPRRCRRTRICARRAW